jgi:hypothetical protein
MTCSTCLRATPVSLCFEQRIGRRVVTWRVCVGCWKRENELGDERAQVAIEEAERSGV